MEDQKLLAQLQQQQQAGQQQGYKKEEDENKTPTLTVLGRPVPIVLAIGFLLQTFGFGYLISDMRRDILDLISNVRQSHQLDIGQIKAILDNLGNRLEIAEAVDRARNGQLATIEGRLQEFTFKFTGQEQANQRMEQNQHDNKKRLDELNQSIHEIERHLYRLEARTGDIERKEASPPPMAQPRR